jgi:hypothetical protein
MSSSPHIISRCVTVYRQWEFINLWIDNENLFQAGIDWMILNDCPEDQCPEPLRKKLSARNINLVQPRFNLGRSNARNYCCEVATSYWIEFIDGDDIPLPLDLNYLSEHQNEYLLHYHQANYSYVNGIPEPSPPFVPAGPMCPGLLKNLEHIQCRPASLIYPKPLLIKVGGFDGRFDTIEDYHLLWKMDQIGTEAICFNSPKQLYRISGGPARSDWDYNSLHKVRFFRTAIADSDNQKNTCAGLWLESNEITAAGMLLTDLYKNKDFRLAQPPDYLATAILRSETSSQQLFWAARKLWLITRPKYLTRLREALKLILGV